MAIALVFPKYSQTHLLPCNSCFDSSTLLASLAHNPELRTQPHRAPQHSQITIHVEGISQPGVGGVTNTKGISRKRVCYTASLSLNFKKQRSGCEIFVRSRCLHLTKRVRKTTPLQLTLVASTAAQHTFLSACRRTDES